MATHFLSQQRFGFLVYRYRYLVTFAGIGFLSILIELALVQAIGPTNWPWAMKIFGFLVGLGFSFALNAGVNFRVPPEHLRATFLRFAAVSGLSFVLNMLLVSIATQWAAGSYGQARLISSGVLFLLAYTLHRRWTFDLAHDFGVAVYAAQGEDAQAIHAKIGFNCDHVHIDLVDATFAPTSRPVDLTKLDDVRKLWPGLPVALHLMTREPSRWLPEVWDRIDWVLLPLETDDDLAELVIQARLKQKKVGVVWHAACTPLAHLLPWLPHVDFALVLGIPEPGRSGQVMLEEAVAGTELLDRLRPKYGYEVIFDGGVNPATVGRIRAKYLVAASAVLKADDPIRVASSLRTGARYERRVA